MTSTPATKRFSAVRLLFNVCKTDTSTYAYVLYFVPDGSVQKRWHCCCYCCRYHIIWMTSSSFSPQAKPLPMQISFYHQLHCRFPLYWTILLPSAIFVFARVCLCARSVFYSARSLFSLTG